MQANKFVEMFGWDKAKEFSQITIKGLKKDFCFEINTGESVGLAYVNLNDLKRLVESWELIESLGGLVKAKTNLSSVEYNLSKSVWFGEDKLEKENFASRLRQAIADVESCHEN